MSQATSKGVKSLPTDCEQEELEDSNITAAMKSMALANGDSHTTGKVRKLNGKLDYPEKPFLNLTPD